jgi:tetratricopeptide (TPR) repeat protein
LEKDHRWLDATKQYEEAAITYVEHDSIKEGELHERVGYCYHRAAYQSETNEEFMDLIGLASRSYEKSIDIYRRVQDKISRARHLHCEAQTLYLKSWLHEDTSKRENLLDQCLETGRKALEEWNIIGDFTEYLNSCNEFLTHLYARSELVTDHREARKIIEEALEYGEAAIERLDEEKESFESTRTRHLLSLILSDRPMEIYDSVKIQQEMMKKSLDNAQEAYETAEQLGDLYLVGRTSGVLSYVNFEFTGDLELSLNLANKQLETAEKTRDTFLKAHANELLAYLTLWKTNVMDEDPEIQLYESKSALEFAEKAIAYYNVISKPIVFAYMSHAGSYNQLARNEIKLEAKRDLFKKGIEVAKKDLEQARHKGSPTGTLYTLHQLAMLLNGQIEYERDDDEKKKQIREAGLVVDELIELSSRMQPYRYWNQSIFRSYSALLKIEQSKMVKEQQRRVDLLLAALSEGEECVRLGKIHLEMHPSAAFSLDFAIGLKKMGELLSLIHEATKENEYIDRAIDTYREVLKTYKDNDLDCRVAETYWKLASIYNRLGRFQESADEFESASTYFDNAAKKMPHLNEFYLEYSKYMKAWSEIKKAKHHNLQKQYDKVKEHYQKAADLHKSTKRWNYLYNNYLAWARLAEAEDLSQNDKTIDARDLFEEIVDMFEEIKKTIQAHVPAIEEDSEKEMAQSLIKASKLRKDYCLGRITLEEAKILDRQGDHRASSRKYDDTTRILQNIADVLDTESERAELLPIISLCKAWKMMTLAEAEASPERYHEAALLFEEAKDHSIAQKSKLLALGHSNFCRALYESAQFEATRDMTNYQTTNQYLTNAANYYVRAGYDPALEYSKAMQRLLDAYVYMNYANSETEPEKKARHYMLAERVLEASADSYLKSNYPEKSMQVNRLLENVRQERRLALSLIEVLEAPIISSSTASFSAPTPTHEYAVGLESFEHANLQASLYMTSEDVKSGVNFNLAIVLFNTGRAPASLVKVEEVIPENFEAVKVSGYYGITDRYLDLKGKKLGPLSTEEVSLVLKPLTKGKYTIEPRIVYVDETGKYRSCEAKPVNVNVREMGILGWIRGPREDG